MGRSIMGLSEVLKGMQTYKEKKSLFPGCAGMNLCHVSLTVNPHYNYIPDLNLLSD